MTQTASSQAATTPTVVTAAAMIPPVAQENLFKKSEPMSSPLAEKQVEDMLRDPSVAELQKSLAQTQIGQQQ